MLKWSERKSHKHKEKREGHVRSAQCQVIFGTWSRCEAGGQSTLKFRHRGAGLTWVERSDSRAMDCSRIIIPPFSPYGQILSRGVMPYDGH